MNETRLTAIAQICSYQPSQPIPPILRFETPSSSYLNWKILAHNRFAIEKLLIYSIQPHGKEAGRLLNLLEKDPGTPRTAVRDDYKLIAQAHHEAIPFLITEDAGTMHTYCQRLEKSGHVKTRAVLLTEGFDASLLRVDGQRSLNLPSIP